MDDHKKMRAYMEALEDEGRKIQVFQRELPLCMELVSQAIDTCKKQLPESTSMEGRVFMPRTNSSYDDDDEEEEMSDWLRSASLWNPTSDLTVQKSQVSPTPLAAATRDDDGSACSLSLEGEKRGGRISLSLDVLAYASPPAATTDAAGGGDDQYSGKSAEFQERSKQRKQRRNWSPELHRRFVHALQQLGGSQAATPKQIKEHMKVDGLTNDEIKSHLQKYRLYKFRRPINPTAPPSRENHDSIQQQRTKLGVVGGVWVSPPATSSSVVSVTSSVTGGRDKQIMHKEATGVAKSATASSSTHMITVCWS